jgi:hypothetical protein
MNTQYLIILGAGATLSNAEKKPLKKRPPLDRGFFSGDRALKYHDFDTVQKYLEKTYNYDIAESGRDSLEAVMGIIYSDINNPQLERHAVAAFRALIRLFSKYLAHTTNSLKPTNRFNLYRLLSRLLDNGTRAVEICIITFNQDLQIEKTLEMLQNANRPARCGQIFSFPQCYEITGANSLLSRAPERQHKFPVSRENLSTIRILKLHGSLNWYSLHKTQEVPKKAILNTQRPLHITPRSRITTDMTFKARRPQYTFPVIIPPVSHKAGILQKDLAPLWGKAEIALKHARHIIVFVYSCPVADFESANLLMRSIKQSSDLNSFCLIDPNPAIFQRYASITDLESIHYFKSMRGYLG